MNENSRPLLSNDNLKETLINIYSKRKTLYTSSANTTIITDRRSVKEVCELIIKKLKLKKYTVKLKQRSYDINIKPGIIKELPLLLSEYNENQKWIIISQHKIMELFGYELEETEKK